MQISFIADILGITSSIMAIIGLGGFLSWSVFKGGTNRLSETVLSIFAYAIKTALCLILGFLTFVLGFFLKEILQYGLVEMIISTIGGIGIGTYDETVRNPSIWISYATAAILLTPSYLLSCFSIYTWSIEPWKRFFAVFRNNKREI